MTEALVLRAARTHWTARVAPLAVLWSTVYGAVQVGSHSGTPRVGLRDRPVRAGWGTVALCAAAGSVVAGLTAASRWSLVVAAWAVAATLGRASGLLLLDAVGTLIPGMDIPVQPAAVASRLGAAGLAVLVGATALSHQRRLREACASCGRTERWTPPAGTPRWAWVGAYAAVAGCVVRLAAQYVVAGTTSRTSRTRPWSCSRCCSCSPERCCRSGWCTTGAGSGRAGSSLVAGRRVPRWLPPGRRSSCRSASRRTSGSGSAAWSWTRSRGSRRRPGLLGRVLLGGGAVVRGRGIGLARGGLLCPAGPARSAGAATAADPNADAVGHPSPGWPTHHGGRRRI